MHVFTKNDSGTASNSLIKLVSRPGLSCDIVHFAWSVALVTDIRIFLYYFVKLNFLGFINLDKT